MNIEDNTKRYDNTNIYFTQNYIYSANINDMDLITGNRRDGILERYQEFINMRDEEPDYYCEQACGML